MTQFTQDTVAIQDAEARGTRFRYRRLGIPGRPALLFCQHFMDTADDHDPALSGAFASDREVMSYGSHVHPAAAAYLMKHAGATALVIVLRAPEPGESEVLASHL
jgi:hypothetical protein